MQRRIATLDRRFVYDGWLPLLELDGLDDNAVVRKFTWGRDLSGQRGGAAGVGGLLAIQDWQTGVARDFLAFGDAQGNVGQLVDRANGSIVAKYEYDAYGNRVASSGTYASDNPLRFSSKYYDAELDDPATPADEGLYYYGYRYYSPRLGNWLTRDPIAEEGGLRLHGFVANGPVSYFDSLGLCGQSCKQNMRDLRQLELAPYPQRETVTYLHSCGTYRYPILPVLRTGHSALLFSDGWVLDWIEWDRLVREPTTGYDENSFETWLELEARTCACGDFFTVEFCEIHLPSPEVETLRERMEDREEMQWDWTPAANSKGENCSSALAEDLASATRVQLPAVEVNRDWKDLLIHSDSPAGWGKYAIPWLEENGWCAKFKQVSYPCTGMSDYEFKKAKKASGDSQPH